MKTVLLDYGNQTITINVPKSSDVRTSLQMPTLQNPKAIIEKKLKSPIGSPSLYDLAYHRKTAVIVVSDNTRPVPYKGRNGILPPIIDILKQAFVENILVIIACGTHRPMKKEEIREMLGSQVFDKNISVINHVSTDPTMCRVIGDTHRISQVSVNQFYLDADLKIITGLVEPHFMAGFSGGRKAVCPGICSQAVVHQFHSPSMLKNPYSVSLILEKNPCHEESLTIAKMAGVDFSVNVTINSKKELTGVYCGELEAAHQAAIHDVQKYMSVELAQQYDIVITQAAQVGVNHYQCAKAAIEASRVVKKGGAIILIGNLIDPDPIGGKYYKKMLKLLTRCRPGEFIKRISSSKEIVPDQWQVQMWANVFKKLGKKGKLYICSPQLAYHQVKEIPGVNVSAIIKQVSNENDVDFVQRITQQTINSLIAHSPNKDILVLPDGHYVVPVIKRKVLSK